MPAYAYYSQLQLIRKEKSLGSFSIYVCAILLISNILRIFFWLTIGYAVNLLFQSICIIAIMVGTYLSSSSSSRTASNSLTTPSRRPPSSKDSGSGRPTKNIVRVTVYSQVFTGSHLIHDHTHPLPSALQFEPVRRGHWLLLHEHIGYSGLPSGHFELHDEEREGAELHDDRDVVFGRLPEDSLLRDGGNGNLMQDQPLQFVMCGVVQFTVDILIVAQIYFYSKN
jgi:hypothetical protein